MRLPSLILLLAAAAPQEEAPRLAAEVFALEPVDPARALASLDRALALAPRDPAVLKARLYLHLRLRDLAGAEDAGRALLAVGGADPYAWIWLGNIAFWRRDLDEAESRYRKALEGAGPTAEDAKAKLVQVADERAYHARARVLARRSLAFGGLALLLLVAGCGWLLFFLRGGSPRRGSG